MAKVTKSGTGPSHLGAEELERIGFLAKVSGDIVHSRPVNIATTLATSPSALTQPASRSLRMKIIKQDGWRGLHYGENGRVTFKSNSNHCHHCILWYGMQIGEAYARMEHARRFVGVEPVLAEFEDFVEYGHYMTRIYLYFSEM